MGRKKSLVMWTTASLRPRIEDSGLLESKQILNDNQRGGGLLELMQTLEMLCLR